MEDNTLTQILELGTEELIQVAVSNNEGVIASNGALSLRRGKGLAEVPMTALLSKKTALLI